MASANKYKVGVLARKHLLSALEILLGGDEDSIVFIPPVNKRYDEARYELRARRVPHGVELKWAKPGTFHKA